MSYVEEILADWHVVLRGETVQFSVASIPQSVEWFDKGRHRMPRGQAPLTTNQVPGP